MNSGLHIKSSELKKAIPKLYKNQQIFLTGKVYTARDAAHKKIHKLILENKPLPIDLDNAIIYYTGPTPTPPGMIIGSCGPTTSYRMDKYLPDLLRLGVVATIGKGIRSEAAENLIKEYNAVYLTAIGGAGALACKYVKSVKEVAFLNLGCESIKELIVEEFPLVVAIV